MLPAELWIFIWAPGDSGKELKETQDRLSEFVPQPASLVLGIGCGAHYKSMKKSWS